MAHLLQASGYRQLASDIDSHFHLAEVVEVATAAAEIDTGAEKEFAAQEAAKRMMDWAATHGFKLEELAAIQPGYTSRDQCRLICAVYCVPTWVILIILLVIAFVAIGTWSVFASGNLSAAPRWLIASGIMVPVALCFLLLSMYRKQDRLTPCIVCLGMSALFTLIAAALVGFFWATSHKTLPDWVTGLGFAAVVALGLIPCSFACVLPCLMCLSDTRGDAHANAGAPIPHTAVKLGFQESCPQDTAKLGFQDPVKLQVSEVSTSVGNDSSACTVQVESE